MRRAYLAIFSGIATLFALIGGRYFVVAPANAEPAAAPSSQHPTTQKPRDLSAPRGGQTAKPSVSATPSAGLSPSASPGGDPTADPDDPQGDQDNPPTQDPGGGGPEQGNPPQGTNPPPGGPCSTYDGQSVWIGPVAHYGTAFVTIKVCGGVMTEAAGGVMLSNWEPDNSNAIAALNQLALQYYRTDISKISFAGATETSLAYQTSLRSALDQAGI